MPRQLIIARRHRAQALGRLAGGDGDQFRGKARAVQCLLRGMRIAGRNIRVGNNGTTTPQFQPPAQVPHTSQQARADLDIIAALA